MLHKPSLGAGFRVAPDDARRRRLVGFGLALSALRSDAALACDDGPKAKPSLSKGEIDPSSCRSCTFPAKRERKLEDPPRFPPLSIFWEQLSNPREGENRDLQVPHF